MASVDYNRKKQTFTAVWKDYAKEALGKKYPYGRKSEKWKGEQKPTAEQVKQKKKSMLDEALNEEFKSKEKAAYIRIHGNEEDLLASGYLTAMSDRDLCNSDNPLEIKRARFYLNEFVAWLDNNYKKVTLKSLDEEIATEYYRYLRHERSYAYATTGIITKRLRFILNHVERKVKGFNNPFKQVKMSTTLPYMAPCTREVFTYQELNHFIISTFDHDDPYKQLQEFATFYFLIVTGWRVHDVLLMKWSQINMQNNTVTVTHSKTKNRDITTVLRMTSLMRVIFELLKLLQEKAPQELREYVFCYHKEGIKMERAPYGKILYKFKKVREELGYNTTSNRGRITLNKYTIHSFRGTVVTRLLLDDFQEARINKLVGHTPRTTEERAYLKFTPDDLAALVEHMEEKAGMKEYIHDLELFKVSGLKKAVRPKMWSDMLEDKAK